MNNFKIVVFLSISLVTCVALVLFSRSMSAGHKEFERLLKGDVSVDVKSIRIVGHGQEILLDDPKVINYIINAIRGRRDNTVNGRGYSYSAIVTFSSGASTKIGCETPDNEDGVIINFPYGGDPPVEFWVPFRRPIPPAVEELRVKMGWRREDDGKR